MLLKNAGDAPPLKRSAKLYVAGSNANDLGNHGRRLDRAVAGRAGQRRVPGTTILQGIRQAARNVTYSADASAPMTGRDVGVVVVGKTPYADGFGDVGGPTWSDDGVPRPAKSLTRSPAPTRQPSTRCATPCRPALSS